MNRDSITSYLDQYLQISDISDISYNGLQFEGDIKITKVVTAVDAGNETFAQALEAGANYIIVHHGHFWQRNNPSIAGWQKQRLQLLWQNNISLYVAHLPLDRHPDVGNNAQILKILNARKLQEFMHIDGKNVGWLGETELTSINQIEQKLTCELNAKCQLLPFGKPEITRVAVCSGGGSYQAVNDAISMNADLLITGDTAEVYHLAKDAGLHIIFAGHHATEIPGVKALAHHLREELQIDARFIDIPTNL